MRNRVQDWLSRLPMDDTVDRKNAVFMQLLLVFSGCKIPLNQLYLLNVDPDYMEMFSGRSAVLPAAAAFVDLAAELLLAVSAWVGVVLIRRGRFRTAVKLFLLAMTVTSLTLYATFGYHRWTGDLMTIEALAVGGLMLGRRALWWTFPAFMASYAVGMTRDYLSDPDFGSVTAAYSGLLPTVFSYLILVLIVDWATTALRTSLDESNEWGRRLQQEVAERERAQEELLHAQKMDAVGRVASGVAHDFGNVLGVILGFCRHRHRLDEPGSHPATEARMLADALEGVEVAARRGTAVNRKLLDLSRNDTTHAEVFDLNTALTDVQPLVAQMIGEGVEMTVTPSAGPLPVCLDRSQLGLAILNIAANARDALGGTGRFVISTNVDNGDAVIGFDDNGPGMTAEVKAQVLEPFFTTKPTGAGTGLGLTIVDRLVKEAGGSIRIDSHPGRGTRIEIRLPLAVVAA